MTKLLLDQALVGPRIYLRDRRAAELFRTAPRFVVITHCYDRVQAPFIEHVGTRRGVVIIAARE